VVDTHCHLDSCRAPVAELVERARTAGVTRLATVGMNDQSIARGIAAAHEHDGVFAIVGRHPHETAGWKATDIDPVERAAADPKVRAIGETGLDYFRDRAPRDDQRRAFEAHIELATRLGLPLVIHTRDAIDDTLAMLRGAGTDVVMHCFSAPERLEDCVERRYYCSFAGNVTYPKATALADAARQVPDDLLLVETDSPYLAPQEFRGKPNEPANVVATAKFLSELRSVTYEQLEAAVERSASRVFKW
jgi:TatD DNase family protein